MMSSGIGNFLRQYRQNNNLSRESFAEMLDISVAFLAAIELGTKKPAYDTLIKITLMRGGRSLCTVVEPHKTKT